MNWLDEVRETLRGLNVDTVEMDDVVTVRFGIVSLWLTSTRQIQWYANPNTMGGPIPRATRSKMELIEDNLAARGWRVL